MQQQVSRCYYHSERSTVAVCAKCGVGICEDCAVKDNHGSVLCYQCANERLKREHKEFRKALKENGGRFINGKEFIAPGIVGIVIVIVFGVLSYYGFVGMPLMGGWWMFLPITYSLFSTPFCYITLNDLFAPKCDTRNNLFFKWYLKVIISVVFGWLFFTFIWIRFIIRKFKSKKSKN